MDKFQKIAEGVYGQSLSWFFEQWLGNTDLPKLKLEAATCDKEANGWRVSGRLLQVSKRFYRLPTEDFRRC